MYNTDVIVFHFYAVFVLAPNQSFGPKHPFTGKNGYFSASNCNIVEREFPLNSAPNGMGCQGQFSLKGPKMPNLEQKSLFFLA